MPVKSTQEVGERGRRNGDGPRFAPATTTAAARHRWTTAPGGRAPRPVKATHGKQRITRCQSSAAAAHGPRRRCWAARGDVGGPQNAASGGGVGRAMRHAPKRRQQAAASPAAGGSTYSRTAVARRPPRRLWWVTPTCADGTRSRGAVLRAGGASSWAFKNAPSCVRVQQRSAGKPLRRETYERKRRVLGAD